MTKAPRLSRLGVLAPAALSACIDASVLAAPAAGAILSTVLKELSKAFMLKKWFHGVMNASEAEHLLMQKGKNGSYLVRESQSRQREFVLSVRVRGRVSHVMIRKEHNKYNVGTGEVFDDLSDLIEHCRAYPLIETSGDVLRLMQPVNYPWASNQPRDMIPGAPFNERRGVYDEGSNDNEGQSPPAVPAGPLGSLNSPSSPTQWLKVEYELLRYMDMNTPYSKNVGMLYENRFRNRYPNVLPYDQTRVRLPNVRNLPRPLFNDYINASYILPMEPRATPNEADNQPEMMDYAGAVIPSVREGVAEEEIHLQFENLMLGAPQKQEFGVDVPLKKKYIATQGCLWTTMKAFWQMVLDNDVRIIVMLANVVEDGKRKCEKYWPFIGTHMNFHNIVISNIGEVDGPIYVYRRFKLVSGVMKPLYVYQFQFKHWPDQSTPADTDGILTLIEDINKPKYWDKLNSPMVNTILVHCSAGVGRTGTFIALDMILDQLKSEGIDAPINMRSVVEHCRAQRSGMVQNFKQYHFLHLAIQDYINAVKEQQRADDESAEARAAAV